MGTQAKSYGAVSVEHYQETAPLNNDGFEQQVHDRPTRRPLAWIVGVGAFFTLSVLLFSQSSNHGSDNVSLLGSASRSPENQPLFYKDQLVDHFDENNDETWSNRYYKSKKYFKGAGHPIFMIVGGEGALDTGMLYPFVTEVLAKKFGAAVLEIEHRFYGPYVPVENATSDELLKLLKPAQAMKDMVQLTKHVRDTDFIVCSPDRDSPNYCPIVTVGASYPGFLSFLLRIVHGDFVDISYASSAPLYMYARQDDQYIYYDIVTSAADRISPGCSHAVRTTMDEMVATVDSTDTLKEAAKTMGICTDSIPKYMKSPAMLREAIIQIASYAFADYDSTCYPPGPETEMYKACRIFKNDDLDTKEKLSIFFHKMLLEQEENDSDFDSCFDLSSQLPDGPDSTLEDTAGDYNDGRMWDFQTCTAPVFLCGFSNSSLFPPQHASMRHLADRCEQKFGVTPRPTELVDTWDYINKLQTTSHILFVNGVQDMWAGGSEMHNVSDTVVAINLENGAHHSDLSHTGPSENDTPDLKQAFVQIQNYLELWLNDIQNK
jgi:hypothetical protein